MSRKLTLFYLPKKGYCLHVDPNLFFFFLIFFSFQVFNTRQLIFLFTTKNQKIVNQVFEDEYNLNIK